VLPAGASGDTLRHDGVEWVAATNVVNDGTAIVATGIPMRVERAGLPTQFLKIDNTTPDGALIRAHSGEGNKKPLILSTEHNNTGNPAGDAAIVLRTPNSSGAPRTRMRIVESGEVGLGNLVTPEAPLHVEVDGESLADPLGAGVLEFEDILVEATDAVLGLYSSDFGTWGSAIALGEVVGGLLTDKWAIARQTSSNNSDLVFTHGTSDVFYNNTESMRLSGFGRLTVAQALDVGPAGLLGLAALTVKQITFDQDTAWFDNDGAGTTLHLEGNNGLLGKPVLRIDQKGTGNFISTGGSQFNEGPFSVTSTGRVVTSALEITGGGDLVEGFETGGTVYEPGTVLVIDLDTPGELITSATAYDRRVAGVVSGAGGVKHGIRMGQQGVLDGDTLVAMAGRVYVKCTTENGAIEPGDQLTTSSVRGHAMKATDSDRWDGAVVGKAMTALEDGTGLVLVLVNL
jgi:hypothetical protein